MKIMKLLTVLCVSLMLLSANIAQAAMLCCVKTDISSALIQAQDQTAQMPCHQNVDESKNTKQNNASCKQCKDCVAQAVSLMTQSAIYRVSFYAIKHHVSNIHYISQTANIIYSPPKFIS